MVRDVANSINYSYILIGALLLAITSRTAPEVESTTREISRDCPTIKVIGVVADGCKLADLEMLVAKVRHLMDDTTTTDEFINSNEV